MTRKDFIERMGMMLGALSIPSLTASAATAGAGVDTAAPKLSKKEQKALADLTEARHKARWKTRRIICNNDGNDAMLAEGELVTKEMFLAKRTTGLVGSQVDTVMYCTGITFGGGHRCRDRFFPQMAGWDRCCKELDKLGTDPLQLVLDYCHQHGIEVFWSHRMNDRHDSQPLPGLVSHFKKAHPEYLMEGTKDPTCFDYAIPQVREKLVDFCTEVVQNYDVDGIELDWFRHLRLFRSVVEGGVASDEEREMINDMMRKLRAMLDREGLRRSRPVLLAVRVPDSREYARLTGIDYEQWLKEDLVDLLIVNDYIKLEPWKNYPEFARKYDVPAYACLENRRLSTMDIVPGTQVSPEGTGEAAKGRFRSEAYAAWLSGMNGIYTFNCFDPLDELFRQIGDPRVLAGMKVQPRESYGMTNTWKGIHYLNVRTWLKSGDKYLKIPSEHTYMRPAKDFWPDSDLECDINP